MKRIIEAGAPGIYISKRIYREKKKSKSLSAPAVSNLHWEAPILKVQARY